MKVMFVLLAMPPAVTETGPVAVVVGTVATMLVFDQLLIVAACPPKVTVPWV